MPEASKDKLRRRGARAAAPAAASAGAAKDAGKAAPAAPARSGTFTRTQVFIFSILFVALLVPSALAYWFYGPTFFMPDEFTRLKHTAEEWQEMLRNRTIVMIGGPHRSGTSLLWQLVREHPSISHFGEQHQSGADYSEGIFVQNVYPRFGVGQEFSRPRKWKPLGLGRYALGEEANVHWTEGHHKVTAEHQAQLLNEFGRFWELSADKPVLLEKSPPNVVLSTYLQAVLNLGNAPWVPVPPDFGGGRSVARFVFISRHPLGNAFAHKALPFVQNDRLSQLVLNWLAIHEYLEADVPRLQHARVLTLEALAREPVTHVSQLWEWLGLPPQPELAERVAASVKPHPNAKYVEKHCASMKDDPVMREAFVDSATELNPRVRALSLVQYDLLDDEWSCPQTA